MFDPEYIMTLYFVGDEALTQADVDQLSEWIGQSRENAVTFIRASFAHRAIHDSLVGTSLKKNVLLDSNETTNSGYELAMGSNVSLRGVDLNDVRAKEKEEAAFLDNDIMQLILELSEEEKTAPTVELPEEEPPRELIQKVVYPPLPRRKMTKLHKFAFITAAAAIFFMIALPKIALLINPEAIEVATLVDQAGAKWVYADSGETLQAGARLWSHGEPFLLRKGTARIRFDYGAEVIIEGPAEFEPIDEEKMILYSGRLYATVQKGAVGFTAVTPSATIIDLGTQFGVEVGFDGTTDVHMFEGKASLVTGKGGSKGEAVSLLAGNANRVNTDGHVQKIKLKEKAFVRPTQHEWMTKAANGSAYHRWLLNSNQLRQDRSLVAYYTFEKNEQRSQVLENKASVTGVKLDGELHSVTNGELPAWTTGRWPQKTALNFDNSERQVVKGPSDPALHINGPVTIAAWIKCDDPNDGGTIVSCSESKEGSNFVFGYKSPSDRFQRGKFVFYRGSSEPRNNPNRVYTRQVYDLSDQWKCVAVTHDNRVVKFYVDGRLVETREYESYHDPIAGSDLVIGSDYLHRDWQKFSGEMDELMIFNRVLTPMDISNLYKAGQPD